jgi:hypothetical protein
MKHHIDQTGTRVSEYVTEAIYTFCQHDAGAINQHLEIMAFGDGWYLKINGGSFILEAVQSNDELMVELGDLSETVDLKKYAPALRVAMEWALDRAPIWSSCGCRRFYRARTLNLATR